MNIDYLRDQKIADDTREEYHKMQLLKEDNTKVLATLESHNKPIVAQPGLFDFMKNTWNEMLETNQSSKYF